MVLKRLEVYGFKSFADKLAVDFDDGMTGIVGPNGCGKSNVADAVRWVLGEQSPKSLRGSSMQDVIFSGTTNRKSLSYCEVSLYFDNSNKIFNVPFEEVVITRKLYRSGESDYLLNRESVRRKDITSMMHDTGAGKEGYSIIGQGRVEEIFRSKPEDRRAIFEEAAGIAKFKGKKLEAERSLARTRDNMEKLQCILLELEKQLGPLERQSRDALKYRELKRDLQSHEVNNFLYNYRNNEKVIGEAKARINSVKEAYDYKISQVEEADKKFRKNSAEFNNLDAYVSKLREEQMRLMVDAQRQFGDEKLIAQQLEYAKARLEKLAEEASEHNENMAIKSQSLTKFVEKTEVKKKELAAVKIEYDSLSEKKLEIATELVNKEKEIELGNSALIDTINMLSDVKADYSELAERLNALGERRDETKLSLAENQRAIEKAENDRRELEKDSIFSNDEKAKQAAKYKAMVDKEEANRNFINTANGELRQLSIGIGALQARIKHMKEMKESYEAYGSAVRQLMQASKLNIDLRNKIDGVVAEVISVPREYETAIEVALGAAMQNIITADESDAKYIIQYLKSKQFGRVTFLPLTSARDRGFDPMLAGILKEKGCAGLASKLISYDKKYNAIFSGLLGRTLIVDNMDTAIAISRKYDYAYKVVTLEGEVFMQGSITGGSRASNITDVLKLDREIETSAKQFEQSNIVYQHKTQKMQEAEAEVEKLSSSLRHAEQALREIDVQAATASERLHKAAEGINLLLQSSSRLSQGLLQLEEKIEETELKIQAAKDNEQAIKGQNKNRDSIIKQSKELFGDKKQMRDTISEQLINSRVKITSLEKDISSNEAEILRLKDECEDLAAILNENRVMQNSTRHNVENYEKELGSAVITEADKKRNEEIKQEIEKADDYKKTVQQELMDANNEKDALNKEILEVSDKLNREQNNLERIDAYMRNLEEYIFTEYGLNYDTALPFMREDVEPSTLNGEITRLKRQISSIGSVNEEAVEQFKEVQTRHSEMKVQYDDLVVAEVDLVKIIDDLAKEMLERFEIEFNKINASFKVIFKDLFGGGSANLVIDKSNTDDPLQAGIEIMAQPPGKNLSRISLLSGGEMTITAIAILFAILRQKPLPFCVLDEVEAALDDSNAGLVAQYIKKYSKETQFIVITHRKPTMEMADRLYGVTMQEKGVSKMISVKLDDAVRNAEPA